MFDSIVKLNRIMADLTTVLDYSRYTPRVHIINKLIKVRDNLNLLISELKGE